MAAPADATRPAHTTRDLWSDLDTDAMPATHTDVLARAQATTATTLSYAQAQLLMALCRSEGPQALTPEQHQAIWECLLARPQSDAWLANQLQAIQHDLQER